MHTLAAFQACPEIDGIVLVGNAAERDALKSLAENAGVTKPLVLAEGGATRQESVYRGLLALPDSVEIVAIHDAARPLVTSGVIVRTVSAAKEHGAALATIPAVDTIKRVDANGTVAETLPRAVLQAAQTPQTFRLTLIRDAHERARQMGYEATDDAALAEWSGHPVQCVEGSRRNIKITTPEDLLFAEALLKPESSSSEKPYQDANSLPQRPNDPTTPRIGFGYDIHRLKEGRRLVLGGVEIPHSHGLDGHSDADVMLHALMDALLGAAGLPDIGHLFPNTDERWRGVSSRGLLREVARQLAEAGFRLGNVDVTLIAERPKIAPYVAEMRAAIAEDLSLPEAVVGIKATTNERVGAVGREEAMAAQAVALLTRLEIEG